VTATTAVVDDELVDDTIAWPILMDLVQCLCAELAKSNLPPVCICSPMPGETIAVDYVTAEAGMAWVRLVQAYPSTNFPAQTAAASCGAPLAIQYDVGVAYCAPTLEEDGSAPGMLVQFETTQVQLAAMAAIRRAILCCLGAATKDAVLGLYTPMGPAGGVVGGFWTVAIAQGAIRRA
jgi:hypothetical protein